MFRFRSRVLSNDKTRDEEKQNINTSFLSKVFLFKKRKLDYLAGKCDFSYKN